MTKPLNVLIVGINYAPEIISTAVYTTDLAEFLADHGHGVDVVTAHPYFPEWRRRPGWLPFLWRTREQEGVRIVHCPIYIPKNPTGLRRILHHASFALSIVVPMACKCIQRKPDIVFVVAPSLLAAPIAWICGYLSRAKCWLHVQDFEVDAAFATGLLREGSALRPLALRFEAWVLRLFARVSTISPQMLSRLVEKGVPRSKTHELRNWADLSKITPLDGASPLKGELGITSKHVALYSGNLGNKQGLEIIVELARHLVARHDITIVIAGDGPMRVSLEKAGHGLPNLRFVPLQPINRLNDLLGMADIHLLPQVAGAADLVLPSKLTNILASGRPVVATAVEGTGLWREVQGVGLTVPPEDSTAITAAVVQLIDEPELRAKLGVAAQKRAVERWSKDHLLGEFLIELETLADRQEVKSSVGNE